MGSTSIPSPGSPGKNGPDQLPLAPDPRPDPSDNPWVRGLPPLRPLGWAGLLMPVPANWNLFLVEGDANIGKLGLSDHERPRLRLQWGAVTRRRFDPDRFVRRRLNLASGKPKDFDGPRVMEHPALRPLMVLADDAAEIDRAAGYCPATGRVIEAVYHRGSLRENRAWSTAVLPYLADQPRAGPARWSFFDVSFVSPPGYGLDKPTLNLGDMRVDLRLRDKPNTGPALGVRHLYPAGLALARRPMEDWLRAWGEEFRQFYRPRRASILAAGRPEPTPVQTSLGPGLTIDLRFRPVYRPVYRKAPMLMRLWLVHDARANRLIGLWATDSLPASQDGSLDRRLADLLLPMHWAGLPGESTSK